MKKGFFLIIILISSSLKLASQADFNFDSIRVAYTKERLRQDFEKSKLYSFQFLNEAKKLNDTSKIAEAYSMLSNSVEYDSSLIYTDSAIAITKHNPNFWQPAQSYLFKAARNALEGNYKNAFIEIDSANKYVRISNNEDQKFEIKYLLSRFYTDIGDYNASIESIKSILSSYTKANADCDNCNRTKVILLWAYANNLNLLKESEKTEEIYKEAFPMSLKTQDSVIYYKLLLASAITKFHKKNYNASLDSIIKLEKLYEKYDLASDILRHLYKGKIYLHLNQDNQALSYFKKTDSISESKNYFHPAIIENYEVLVNYYKERDDYKNQLVYINKLLKADSVIKENNSYLIKNINKKYTTPNLLLEKQKIIDTLENDHSSKNFIILILVIFVILISLILFLNNKKRKIYKKRISELGKTKKAQSYNIDNDTTKRILDQLSETEALELFLNKDFNLSYLAKKLDTNTSYLSKIINEHKGKSFKQYLTELRINALIKKLDENTVMRKYSIEALAESIGYNNASSFTRIFKNYLGESPSSFLDKKYPERKS